MVEIDNQHVYPLKSGNGYVIAINGNAYFDIYTAANLRIDDEVFYNIMSKYDVAKKGLTKKVSTQSYTEFKYEEECQSAIEEIAVYKKLSGKVYSTYD